MLRVKGLVKIVNRKGKRTNQWVTYIFLNKKNYDKIKIKAEAEREIKQEYNRV